MNIDSKTLLTNLEKVFLEAGQYLFDKHVPEFLVDGKFLGDAFMMTMVEPNGENPPRFYHTFSPFDVISNKAPDRALVFENGELVFETDFASYVDLRTGAMDSLLLRSLGVSSLKNKKVLFVGGGKVAQAALHILKDTFADLSDVACINHSGDLSVFQEVGSSTGVDVSAGNLANINVYDYIFCHTNAKEQVLTSDMIGKIKDGAVINSFISSTEHGELADEFYDSSKANIICDWEKTLTDAKDLSRALKSDNVKKEDIILLKDLLDGSKSVETTKKYTIYRSTGTPLQNLAILQLLVSQ